MHQQVNKCGPCIRWGITQPWKSNEALTHAAAWVDLENMLVEEARHRRPVV